MQIVGFTQLLILEAHGGTSLAPLPFNPVKLFILILWFYLCLYFAQNAQFSLLVPPKYKTISCIISLIAGPALFLVLLLVDAAKKSSKSGESTFVIIKQQIKNTIVDVWSKRFKRLEEEDDSKIRLLDSSGTELKEIYGHGEGKGQNTHILDLTEQIIANALEQRASDILIDPKDDSTYTIRLRIDGVLIPVKQLKTDTCKAVINSIKAVSSMDISEKRRPQDGAFMAKKGEMTASFRVASAGVIGGEKLSIRILNQRASTFTLEDTGFTQKQYSEIDKAINKPSGMILICGPTGSGKTSTMYAMLNRIDRYTRNVITVEDPIEAVLPESSQIEINPKADITFAKTLRSILRQDPDVICVGEIRDEETAEIALRASQTGHLVLATIHCGSNSMALVRLMDLGISPMLLSSGLNLLISQRLIRLLCNYCKKPAQLTQNLINEFTKKGINYAGIYEAVGCKRCNGTGYFTRTAICDIMEITDRTKADFINSATLITELKSKGTKKDIANLKKEGLKKVIEGKTSLQELKRVVG
jgi:type II secretory ATPase GspE/PulE/Tfp pilus assembly ATPase PilB-like protein